MASPKAEFISGLKAELPIAIGVIPFGLIYGVLALGAGMPAGAAQAMSAIVFAGSSQFITTQLVSQGTPALVIVMTIWIVNLRHMLYSASVAPYVKQLPTRWRYMLAYLLTDEAYAVTITHYQKKDNPTASAGKHWYFLAAGLTLWATWQASTAAGIFLGAAIPASWSLDFTLALTFIGLVVPALRDRPSLAAALTAGIVAILTAGLPYKLWLVAAALAGIAVGFLMEELS